jgi:hypothetical protein
MSLKIMVCIAHYLRNVVAGHSVKSLDARDFPKYRMQACFLEFYVYIKIYLAKHNGC